jgi:hypothetical protein
MPGNPIYSFKKFYLKKEKRKHIQGKDKGENKNSSHVLTASS